MPDAMSRCESCGVPIFWAVHANTGRRMPIDEHPTDAGNVIITGDPRSISARDYLTAEVLGPLEALAHDGELYMPHHATCPDADDWRDTTRAARRRPPRKAHA